MTRAIVNHFDCQCAQLRSSVAVQYTVEGSAYIDGYKDIKADYDRQRTSKKLHIVCTSKGCQLSTMRSSYHVRGTIDVHAELYPVVDSMRHDLTRPAEHAGMLNGYIAHHVYLDATFRGRQHSREQCRSGLGRSLNDARDQICRYCWPRLLPSHSDRNCGFAEPRKHPRKRTQTWLMTSLSLALILMQSVGGVICGVSSEAHHLR